VGSRFSMNTSASVRSDRLCKSIRFFFQVVCCETCTPTVGLGLYLHEQLLRYFLSASNQRSLRNVWKGVQYFDWNVQYWILLSSPPVRETSNPGTASQASKKSIVEPRQSKQCRVRLRTATLPTSYDGRRTVSSTSKFSIWRQISQLDR
jgi:hypothetical protein